MNPIETPRHKKITKFLRIGGISCALVGATLLAVGIVSFFSALGASHFPKLFWCAMLGMPVLFAGAVMIQFGFFGAAIRYMASQTVPVAKDVTHYMAEETQGAVKTMAKAVGEGLVEGMEQAKQKNTPPKAQN